MKDGTEVHLIYWSGKWMASVTHDERELYRGEYHDSPTYAVERALAQIERGNEE